MAAHAIPYMATTSPAYPHDLMAKFKKAKSIKGFRFIHILASCTAGWKIDLAKSIEVMRLATDTNTFPIYEVEDGEKYTINIEPKGLPILDYLKLQGRFAHLNVEEIKKIQNRVDYEWKVLLQRSMMESFQLVM